jgi:casein kinase II subunit beta
LKREAEVLYGHFHARYLLTRRGLALMYKRYAAHAEGFEVCPRVFCRDTLCLPHGVFAEFGRQKLKMLCPQCGDMYTVTAPRFRDVDGAFFGPNYAHMFIQRYPDVVPTVPSRVYVPKIFGFKIYHPGDDEGSDSGSDG